ncbi:MAG: cysteine desulfurase [Clostridia bacterium]|nr:cysteine desulfurase [Clostridia bacterium]
MEAYFDNSATTAPCAEAIEAMNFALRECWGNPSSLHRTGNKAKELLELSRESIAKRLSCYPEEIFFTSGGTESNNLAVIGAANQMKRFGKRIVSTSIEHPSIDETLSRLEEDGFEIIRLKVDSHGKINEKDLFAAVNSNTILITMMLVNNEVGSIMPIASAKRAAMAARSPALIHCDAVQAFGKMPIKPSALGVDLMTISSHKIHGPKGVGALYIRKGVKIKPRTFGGAQEMKIRPGTEAMPAIAGFGAAARALPDPKKELEHVTMLRDYMVSHLEDIDGVVINSPEDALPFVTNISIIGTKSEPMLNFLSERGISVSSGSACSKGKKSHVLAKMDLDAKRLEGPLRISFSRFTTLDEIDYLITAIAEGRKKIRQTK